MILPLIESFELVHVLENVSLTSLAFLGELDKYVSVSQCWIVIACAVGGETNEVVSLPVLKLATGDDFIVHAYNVVVGSSGKTIQFVACIWSGEC